MVYDSAEIETRWQARWRDACVFDAEVDDSREKFYCLEMFPYPSGYMHMGHVRNYSIGDAMARFQRLMGKNVCLLYTSPSPRDAHESRMPSSA